MALTAGARLGSYEITSAIGAGGMGEVYRARDTRLDRDVAIKVLPDSFATDPDRLMRFTREAKTLAALNHPNIATIYGIEPSPSTSSGQAGAAALVMELVEGEDLSSRIAHGPIPLKEALAIARQIAEALEAAHDAGVIHRDLKPANIKVRDDGTVKVLDFGLAKLTQPDVATDNSAPLVNSPTMTSPALLRQGFGEAGTQVGVILGTAAYMAPEQAKGRAIDRRADVWAFGVIFHEMLTGRRLFAAEDVSETLAAVLTREPDWTALPPNTPPSIHRLLARCLARDRKARLDSMTAARLEIEEAIAAPAMAPTAPAQRSGMLLPIAFAFAGLAVGVFAARWLWTGATATSATAAPVVSSIVAAPDAVSAFTYGFALSPDGTTLVYSGRRSDGRRLLWKRRLDDSRTEPMPGTDEGVYPFWSPDSRQVGFFADEKLKTVPSGGGPVQTIAAASGLHPRGSWSKADEILFSTTLGTGRGIQRVPAAGGRPSKLLLDQAFEPQWLPDDRHFLFLRHTSVKTQLAVASVDGTDAPVTIMEDEDFQAQEDTSDPRYSPDGFMVFNRAGVLSRQKFNAATFKFEGPVTRLGDPAGAPRGWYAVTVGGNAVVALNPPVGEMGGTPGDPVSRLLWVNRSGHIVGQLGPAARYWTVRLSRDGRQVLVNSDDYAAAIDTTTQLRTRIGNFFQAVWMPDNKEVLYRGPKALLVRPASGEGEPRVLVEYKDRPMMAWDISPDGRSIAATARRNADATVGSLWLVSASDGSMRPLLTTDNDERQASFSPDGRWIAYASRPSGRFEIYVRQVTGDAPAVRLSADGGMHPQWRGDGQEIFFMSPTDQVMAVDVSSLARTGAAGERKVLFRMVTNDLGREAFNSFGVTPDGQRFLMNVPNPPEPLTLIQLPH